MIVGIPRETHPAERRVALTPAAASTLVKAGLEVRLEAGAGVEAGYSDAEYTTRGVQVCKVRADVFSAAVLFQVRTYGASLAAGAADLSGLRPGQVLLGFSDPLTSGTAIQAICNAGVTLLAVELIPRITRAQGMDALSSQASLAGYRAVLLATQYLRKVFPLMTTAAGTIQPARVLILGAGVAGLQAIATARRLGGVVFAYDVRPGVAEEIRSLGARVLELPLETSQGSGGYAGVQTAPQQQRQQELLAGPLAQADVVIATAAIPGRKAPILVTRAAVTGMKAGSVVVDLAAERGGNCELTVPDQIVQDHGVTILGPTNLASEVAFHASQLYAANLVSLFQLVLTRDGALNLNVPDEIVTACLVCRDGAIVQPQVRQALGMPPLESATPDRSTP